MSEKTGVEGQEPKDAPDDDSEPSPEQVAQLAKDKKLAKEAAGYRVKLRETEKLIQEKDQDIEALRKKLEEKPATSNQDQAAVAALERQLTELRAENKQRAERERALEEKSRKRNIASTLSSLAASMKLNEPASAVELLSLKASVAADDAVVFNVKDPDTGESIEVAATSENAIKFKVVPKIFLPAEGVPGSGSRMPRKPNGQNEGGVDLERAKSDSTYFQEHREEIAAARRKLRGSSQQ